VIKPAYVSYVPIAVFGNWYLVPPHRRTAAPPPPPPPRPPPQRQRPHNYSTSNPRPRGRPLGCTSTEVGLWQIWRYLCAFFAPQVPPPPRCTPVVVSTKLTPRLSLAPCCAGQPPFGHIQAALRRALLPLDMRRRSSQAKIADLTAVRKPKALKKPSRPDACTLTKRAPRRDENLHLADYHRRTATPLGPLVNPSESVMVRRIQY
jgi:hypothetical protein